MTAKRLPAASRTFQATEWSANAYWGVRYYIIFNPKSGTALRLGLTREALESACAEAGLDVEIDASTDDLAVKIDRAAQSTADVVISAGGDGTFTATARALVGSGKTLAILPLGTANLLARDLGVPLALDLALGALAEAQPMDIDVGDVNGRLFLHKVVVGVVPAIAAAREKVRGEGLGALLRFMQYFVKRLANAHRTAVAITSRDTADRVERVHAIAVANNAYDQGWGKFFARSSLTGGTLTLYVLKRLALGDVLRLGTEMIAGRWQEDDGLSIETVRSVNLRTRHRRIAAMVDGEVEFLETPLQFRIRPKALRVLVPASAEANESAPEDLTHEDRPSVGLALRPS